MPSKKNLGDRARNAKLDPTREKRKDSEPANEQNVYFVPEYELSVKAPSIEAAVLKAKRQRESEDKETNG